MSKWVRITLVATTCGIDQGDTEGERERDEEEKEGEKQPCRDLRIREKEIPTNTHTTQINQHIHTIYTIHTICTHTPYTQAYTQAHFKRIPAETLQVHTYL